LYLVASAGPPSFAPLTGSPIHALGLAGLDPGYLGKPALRAGNRADSADT